MKTKYSMILIGVLFLVGCAQKTIVNNTRDIGNSPQKGIPAKTVDIAINAYNYGFAISPAEINKGDIVRIRLRNQDGMHGLAIPAFDIDSGPIAPGEETTLEFIADKSGSFDYYCNVPCGSGHSNMKGKLVVR
jgi:cytochrome c oxidase subunit 2